MCTAHLLQQIKKNYVNVNEWVLSRHSLITYLKKKQREP